MFGRVGRLFELCAGPGYIGFSLLAHGLCEHLVLGDVNPRAIEAQNETVRLNGLEDKVTTYQSDGLEGIPADERWDLVVVNPPHFDELSGRDGSLVLCDPEWRMHRNVYRDVGEFLNPGGSVLMLESTEGSTPEDFKPMIAEGGLSHRTMWYSAGQARPIFYFMWAQKTLPGVTFGDDPVVLHLPLREPPGAPLVVPAGLPCSLHVVNEADRPVRPRVFDASGTAQMWKAVDWVPAGGTAVLPIMAFRAGEYEVRDRKEGETIGRIVAQ
jgi:hypothetical protein